MSPRRRSWLVLVALAAVVGVQCAAPAPSAAQIADGERAFATVYRVLQHPRCKNCHPIGRVPLQGDAGRPHAQHVVGGDDGKGVFAMKCATCHFETPKGSTPNASKGSSRRSTRAATESFVVAIAREVT